MYTNDFLRSHFPNFIQTYQISTTLQALKSYKCNDFETQLYLIYGED